MTAKELGEALTMIAEKAKPLRDAGVFGRVRIGDVEFEVCDIASPQSAPAVPEAPVNALDDGDTYGGFVPQRKRPPQATEEESDDE